jgi:hypothetical protein
MRTDLPPTNHTPDHSLIMMLLLLRFSVFALALALAQATEVDEYELYNCANPRSSNPNAW